MKKIIFLLCLSFSFFAQSQDNGTVFGGFESNAQWYLNDKNLLDEFNNSVDQPEHPIRSNNYLYVNYHLLNKNYILVYLLNIC